MREFRTYGSVRGVPSNGHPYRDNRPKVDVIVNANPNHSMREARLTCAARVFKSG